MNVNHTPSSASIKTAVFPVAGFGTRMLPATKTIPKEMLPVLDKPLIDYVVREAREAGIERLIFVTGRDKEAIEDYFDHSPELEVALERKGKTNILQQVQDFPKEGMAVFVRQQQAKGLGHAVWCARHCIDGAFAVLLPDVILKEPGFLKRMVECHEATGANVLALYEVPRQAVSSYGIAGINAAADAGYTGGMSIQTMVEKPSIEEAPSAWSVMGRYILTPRILELLANTGAGAGGEIQLTDAMSALLAEQPFIGLPYTGKMFDCGSREGFIEANLDYAYDQPEIKAVIDAWFTARSRS